MSLICVDEHAIDPAIMEAAVPGIASCRAANDRLAAAVAAHPR
jgi:hypothetical protein